MSSTIPNCHSEKNSHDHCHSEERPTKVGILLAMFGTTDDEAAKDYDYLESKIQAKFQNIPIFRSYTADKIRRKLVRKGETAYSVSQALMFMHDQGFTHVAVQSIHTVPAIEFEWTEQQAKAHEHPRKGLQKISVGKPLITTKMLHHVAEGIPSYIPSSIHENDIVVLVGHGTYHAGQVYYHALEAQLSHMKPHVILGTLMGDDLGIGSVLGKLKQLNAKRVHLIPFMGVAGHHYIVDIAGDTNSWASILRKHGYDCMCHTKGTASHDHFVNIWINNLHMALRHLGKKVHDIVPPLPELTVSYHNGYHGIEHAGHGEHCGKHGHDSEHCGKHGHDSGHGGKHGHDSGHGGCCSHKK